MAAFNYYITFLFTFNFIQKINSYVANDLNLRNVQPISEETIERIITWTSSDSHQPWEISGQLQGDIVLEISLYAQNSDRNRRWPNNTIIYQFDKQFAEYEREAIRGFLQDFSNLTQDCVRTKERTKERDYVYITKTYNGCWSNIGFIGGKQSLNLQPGCINKGTVLHEFMHTFGFWHQHQYPKRDDYIEIVSKNIDKKNIGNFDIERSLMGDDSAYDYSSILHYGPFAFSNNGQKTILAKIPGSIIGSQGKLTNIDLTKLMNMYNCKNKED